MREYIVTFATKEQQHETVLFAKDRADAIAFAKRNAQAHIWRDGWRLTGAKLKSRKRTQEPAHDNAG